MSEQEAGKVLGIPQRTTAVHELKIITDKRIKRGWYLSWRCARRGCDTAGNATLPTREKGVQLFDILAAAHLSTDRPDQPEG